MLKIHLTGYEPSHSVLNFVFAQWIFTVSCHFDNVDETYLDKSRCNKLVTITSFGICFLNMVLRSISCQQDNQLIWQICLRTVDFYGIDAWKSILQGKNKNILEVYSISWWICLPWDFCASSWDRKIVLKTVRLERSVTLYCINRFSLLSLQMKSCDVTIHMKPFHQY